MKNDHDIACFAIVISFDENAYEVGQTPLVTLYTCLNSNITSGNETCFRLPQPQESFGFLLIFLDFCFFRFPNLDWFHLVVTVGVIDFWCLSACFA